jgi:hypothetical protein
MRLENQATEKGNMIDESIKCKVISFRISDQEYDSVAMKSLKHGFSSVPLFARSLTLTYNGEEPVQSPLDNEINRLWRRVEALIHAVEEITGRLGTQVDPLT